MSGFIHWIDSKRELRPTFVMLLVVILISGWASGQVRHRRFAEVDLIPAATSMLESDRFGGNIIARQTFTTGPAFKSSAGLTDSNSTFSSTQTLSQTGDQVNCGPNPLVDIRCFGARAIISTAAPAIPGVTANCTSGNTTVLLAGSGYTSLKNGDGILLIGCGINQDLETPAAPTVTPSIAAANAGSGIDTAAPPGRITGPCYRIVVRDAGQGISAASPETCVTNGQPLGAVPTAITSIRRNARGVVTATTATNTLSVGAWVQIAGTSDDLHFGGWCGVTSVTRTSLSCLTGITTVRGAPQSATGGNVFQWNENAIKPSSALDRRAIQYAVYVGSTNAERLYAVSEPLIGQTADPSYGVVDDQGSALMGSIKLSPFWPTNYPTSPVPDSLSTTISNHGGTSSIVVTNPAASNKTGTIALFDDTPALKAAVNAAGSTIGGSVYIPDIKSAANTGFIFQFPVTITATVIHAGPIYLADTFSLSAMRWRDSGITTGFGQFSNTQGPLANGFGANPMFNFAGNPSMIDFSGASIGPVGSQYLVFFGGLNCLPCGSISNVAIWGAYNTDYVGNFLKLWGGAPRGGTAGELQLNNISLISGPGTGAPVGVTSAAFATIKNFAGFSVSQMQGRGRGFLFQLNEQGEEVWIDEKPNEVQAPMVPLVSFYAAVPNAFININVKNLILDTGSTPAIANINDGGGNAHITLDNPIIIATNNSWLSGQPFGLVTLIGTAMSPDGLGQDYNVEYTDAGKVLEAAGTFVPTKNEAMPLSVDNGFNIFAKDPPMAAPRCSISSGGNIAVGTYFPWVAPVWASGVEGTISPPGSSCTTSSGKQTVNFTWTPVSGAIGYDIYVSGTGNGRIFCGHQPGTADRAEWSTFTICNNWLPSAMGPSTGATSITSGNLYSTKLILGALNGGGTATVTAPNLSTNRNLHLPDVGDGTLAGNTYSTPSSALSGNTAATMITTTSGRHHFIFVWTVSLASVGKGCTGPTTFTVNKVFTDPHGGGAQTVPLANVSIGNSTVGYNGVVGDVADGKDVILAADGTSVGYAISGWSLGSACSVAPGYVFTPELVLVK